MHLSNRVHTSLALTTISFLCLGIASSAEAGAPHWAALCSRAVGTLLAGDCTQPPPIVSIDHWDYVRDDWETSFYARVSCTSCNPDLLGYVWDFGDGASANGRSVYHTYGTGGKYTVTVHVTEDCGDGQTRTTSVSQIVPVAAKQTVSTEGASEIAETEARVWGRIDYDGEYPCQWRFRYKNNREFPTYLPYRLTPWMGLGTSGQSFSELLTDLTPGSTYYFAAQVRHWAGDQWPDPEVTYDAWGSEQSFTTLGTAPAEWPPAPWPEGWCKIYGGPWFDTTLPAPALAIIDEMIGGSPEAQRFHEGVTSGSPITLPLAPLGYEYRYFVGPFDGDIDHDVDALFPWAIPDGGAIVEDIWPIVFQQYPVWVPLELTELQWEGTPPDLTISMLLRPGASPTGLAWQVFCRPRAIMLAVVAQSVTNITETSATLRGMLSCDNGSPRRCAFTYSNDYGEWTTPWTDPISGGQSFSQTITGLTPNETYYCQAITWDGAESFETLIFTPPFGVVTPPTVSTQDADGITETSATLWGRIENDGNDACQYEFKYKEDGAVYGMFTDRTGSATTGQLFSQDITGLIPGTTYHFQARAGNAAGLSAWGDDRSFRTRGGGPVPERPSVSTLPADGITPTSATLWGRLADDGGEACKYRFRYKTGQAPYATTDWTGSVTTGQTFSQVLKGLVPRTVYSFAAQARNSAGEGAWGNDQSLVTPPPDPDPTSHYVIFSSGPGGSVMEPGEGKLVWRSDARPRVVAQPLPGFQFLTWTGTAVAAGKVADPNAATTTVRVDGQYTLKANFVSLLGTMFVSSSAGHDPNADGTAGHPLDSIQEAVEVAGPGSTIMVGAGDYAETLHLQGQGITVEAQWLTQPGSGGMPILLGDGQGPIVEFGSSGDCTLSGFAVMGSKAQSGPAILCKGGTGIVSHCLICGNATTDDKGAVIVCQDSETQFKNCTISGNITNANGAVFACTDSNVAIVNSIVWGNTTSSGISLPAAVTEAGSPPAISYSDVQGALSGIGNMALDPLFASPGHWEHPADPNAQWVPGDYHLMSTAGRWDPATMTWVPNTMTSPCIDAGDPVADWTAELLPNGGRINMGAYGGTSQASHSPQ
jgi:hypothetical protein